MEPFWSYSAPAGKNSMPANLSIKNAPDDLVARLKQRASRHHRSLQGELMAIVEEAVMAPPKRPATIDEYRACIQALGLDAVDESAAMIRADRDARGQR